MQREILCFAIPDPAEELNVAVPEPKLNVSVRESYAAHSNDPQCAACHALIDPVGFLFLNYDAVGRFSVNETVPTSATTSVTKPFDSRGALPATSRGDIALPNAVEASRVIADLPETTKCFASKLETYIDGEPNTCRATALAGAMGASKGDIVEGVVALFVRPEFFRRTAAR